MPYKTCNCSVLNKTSAVVPVEAQGDHPVECNICSNQPEKLKTFKDRQFPIDYFFCCQCAFLFKDRRHILPPGLEQEEYLSHHNTLENKGYVEMLNHFIDECIVPYLPGASQAGELGQFLDCGVGRAALDFGSGPGPVLAQLLGDRGFAVDIYDPYFAPHPGYREKTFEVITATEVLEHAAQPLEIMQHLADRLVPGGIAAVTTLFHPIDPVDPEPGLAQFQDWWYRRDVTHISFFRPLTLEWMARRAGLAVLKITGKNRAVFRKPF